MPQAKLGTLKLSIDTGDYDLHTEVPFSNNIEQMTAYVQQWMAMAKTGIEITKSVIPEGELGTDPSS